MNKIVYYVASSLDGYIAGASEDISGFVGKGNGVEKYLSDLQDFETVIMGRKTYEFGYQYGLQPGKAPYPHMKHYVFSETLQFENPAENVKVVDLQLAEVDRIKAQSKTDVYLCGGGTFAAWLLENERIDILKIKLNPLLLGKGIQLFANSTKAYQLKLLKHEKYEEGLQIISYQIEY